MKQILMTCFAVLVLSVSGQSVQREIDSITAIHLNEKNELVRQGLEAELVYLYFKNNQSNKSTSLYTSCLQAVRTSGNKKTEAQLYHYMGNMHFYEYRIDSAIRYFKLAMQLRSEIKDYTGMLKSTSNLAANYFMKSDFKNSLEYYKIGLELESQCGYEEGEYIDVKNMAIAYRYLKLNNKALRVYRKALNNKHLSTKNYFTIYSGMALLFKDLKNMDSALIYGNRSHELAMQLNDSIDLAFSYSNLGLIQNGFQHYDQSSVLFRKALLISRLSGEKHLELVSWANLAANQLELNRPDSADFYIQKVIELRQQLQIKTDEEDISKLLADYYHRKGDHEKSYQFFKMYDHYRDSIYTLESTAKSIEAQEKFDSEKKEKENQVLQLENESVRSSRNYLLLILAIACLTLFIAVFAYRKIKRSNLMLAQQKKAIEEKNHLLQEQKDEIAHQKELVDEKQKEILDSINYARRIQFALLASKGMLETHLPEHFVLFKPKDVVSGDFYWSAPVADGFILVTADCTGHGVPGAFMSLLNISKLSQTINEKNITRPDLILNQVRTEIIQALNPGGAAHESKDGMDAIVCKFNFKTGKLQYAAANNSFYLIRNQTLIICEADKMPVGMGHDDSKPFLLREIELLQGDVLYTFTDGLADQFGGPKGKKFKYKQFEDILLTVHKKPMRDQLMDLNQAFETWKGDLEQVDDICVLGIKIP